MGSRGHTAGLNRYNLSKVNVMNKWLALAAVVGSTALARAAEGDIVIDTTWVAKLQTAFTTLGSALVLPVLGIVGGFLVFWAIKFVLRIVKRVSSSAA